MFINLGIGLKRRKPATDAMDTDQQEEEGEQEDDDLYKDQAIIDTLIEEFGQRMNEEESVLGLVEIMRKNLGKPEEESS